MATANPGIAPAVTDTALNELLNSATPVLMLLWNGDSLRSDLRTEFDKAATEFGTRIKFAKINTVEKPEAAARFEVDKHAVMVGWAHGELIGRRSRPWGTDVKAMVEQLAALAPAPAVPQQQIDKLIKAPVKVTDATFQQMVIDSELPVLVDFWAEWCGPCKKIAPTLEKLAAEYAGQIIIAKVNVDENPGLSQAFRIQSIPTLMLVKNMQMLGQTAGALPEASLRDIIGKLIAY
jgi:thioredoxin